VLVVVVVAAQLRRRTETYNNNHHTENKSMYQQRGIDDKSTSMMIERARAIERASSAQVCVYPHYAVGQMLCFCITSSIRERLGESSAANTTYHRYLKPTTNHQESMIESSTNLNIEQQTE